MPFLFLSPSTQYFNPYITTGDEHDLVSGANIAGFVKVANAMYAQGIAY